MPEWLPESKGERPADDEVLRIVRYSAEGSVYWRLPAGCWAWTYATTDPNVGGPVE